jgi:hypothetical protein
MCTATLHPGHAKSVVGRAAFLPTVIVRENVINIRAYLALNVILEHVARPLGNVYLTICCLTGSSPVKTSYIALPPTCVHIGSMKVSFVAGLLQLQICRVGTQGLTGPPNPGSPGNRGDPGPG